MDFDLSEEQRLLKESVDGLLGSSYDFDARKKYMAEKGGWSKAVWNKLAEQGLLGLPFSEDDGGFGAGAVETMIVMEAMGKALVLEPYLATTAARPLRLRSSRRTRATTCRTSRPRPRRKAPAGSSTARNSSCSTARTPTCSW
jgi:alkylation response protein AidB-like acyl-CoA dehydrogenase